MTRLTGSSALAAELSAARERIRELEERLAGAVGRLSPRYNRMRTRTIDDHRSA
jgi:hypothetical protein